MAKLQDTIKDLANALYEVGAIDYKTMRDLADDDLPIIIEYTGEEIQQIRKQQKLSQAVFAKYLNISPGMVRSLEQGQRRANGAILKLLNIVEKHGISALN